MESLDTASFKQALIVLGAAGVVVPLFHRLRVSPVVGFILVGVAVGPFGVVSVARTLPWISIMTIGEREAIEPIANLGVALLLFMIGLELSFERLWLMRKLIFGLGALQVTGCTAVLALCAAAARQGKTESVLIGLALAMSSTAVVIQVLSEEKRLSTTTGRISFAILLSQDLAVVPVLFVMGTLAPDMHAAGARDVARTAAQALVAVVAIIALGRLVIRPLFRSVARAHSPEFFVAACLLVVIASGLATAAAGLSMALGALIGGLLLAGTEYRRQVEVTIDPFKGLFIGVFLISVGMSLDAGFFFAHPLLIAGAVSGLLVVKTLLIAGFARIFRLPWTAGIQAGLMLGAGGEFGFVIISLAVSERLLPPQIASLVLIVTALTMAAIPLLSAAGQWLAPRKPATIEDQALHVPDVADAAPRVIIAGFGRVGQMVADMLERHRIPYVAVERDPDRVARHHRQGKPVYFGDMTRIELLNRLHLETARALVITMNDPKGVDELVASARAERDDLLLIARARDATHAAHLYRVGATDAVPETVEASLQLSEAVLIDLGVPMGPVIASIHEKRSELQAGIKAMAPGAEPRELGRRRLRDALR
ncbi:MAG: cation:proton antiporter [Acetobacteraceae bacterium]|nr:cation:proton antiporter [Acetobacteraceae bacterium]